MQILIIRHGDPDYSIDSLTEKGWKEAVRQGERYGVLDFGKNEAGVSGTFLDAGILWCRYRKTGCKRENLHSV